jgi:hypothetical protein
MRCRYCNIALAPSRSFVDGEFCCEDHRQSFEAEGPYATPVTDRVTAALHMLRQKFAPRPSRVPAELDVASQMSEQEEGILAEPELMAETILEDQPEMAESAFASAADDDDQSAYYQPESDDELPETRPHPANETAASWNWLTAAWKRAPRDLKLVGLLLPVLLLVAISGFLPKVPIHPVAPQTLDQVQKVVVANWKNVNQTISDRAAIVYADDFRSGLDAWESHSNLTTSWSYDAIGFVRPGPLAIFKPTIDLSDYRFDFLAEIEQKALGWAFRAEDLKNYYAMKLVVVKPGPLPLVHIVRYAVINGKEGPHVDKPLPMNVRTDMLYRIEVNARGSDFTIMVQGQVVDFWSDNRLRHGGIGFFCNRGERARLRWVEVSHQYDALGRLCAYLAPYGIEGRNGSIN